MTYIVLYNTANGDILVQATLADDSVTTNGLVVVVPTGKALKKIDVETQEPIFY